MLRKQPKAGRLSPAFVFSPRRNPFLHRKHRIGQKGAWKELETMVLGTMVGILTALGLAQVGAWLFKGLWGRHPLRGCYLVVPLEEGEGELERQLRRVRSAVLWGEDLADTQVLFTGRSLTPREELLCQTLCQELDCRFLPASRLEETVHAGR